MKKTFIILSLLFISFFATAQKKPVADTTKSKPTADFVLIGKVEDFQLLLRSVQMPGKITRDDIVYLSQWIKGIQKMTADTTKQKPK